MAKKKNIKNNVEHFSVNKRMHLSPNICQCLHLKKKENIEVKKTMLRAISLFFLLFF